MANILRLIHYHADGTIYFNHESLRTPATKEEIVEVVKSASKDGRKIHVVGSGHSWSHVAHSTDMLLSLHNYAGVVSVDVQEKRITVQAGMTFHTLNAVLDQHGLAMKNLAAISAQTVAGAISTGLFLLSEFNFKGVVHILFSYY